LEQDRSLLLQQIESLYEEKENLQDQLHHSQSLLAQAPPITMGEGGPHEMLHPVDEREDVDASVAPMVTDQVSVDLKSGKV